MSCRPLMLVSKRRAASRAFSLAELLIAIMILGLGLVSIAALLPAGIIMQRSAADDIFGPIVAENAMSILRSKLHASDFGSMEEFTGMVDSDRASGRSDSNATAGGVGSPSWVTTPVPGDWGWKRPGVIYSDLDNANAPWLDGVDETGAIDIFSHYFTKRMAGVPDANSYASAILATEFPSGVGAVSQPDSLWGIPYNRYLYDSDFDHTTTGLNPGSQDPTGRNPLMIVSQYERTWPMPADADPAGRELDTRPQYFWDCMFRRFGGRIQVALFVYRAVPSGGDGPPFIRTPYLRGPSSAPALPGAAPIEQVTFPFRRRFYETISEHAGSAELPWKAGGADRNLNTISDQVQIRKTHPIPGTVTPNSQLRASECYDQWQSPQQWIVDDEGHVHRVVNGRNRTEDGPVTTSSSLTPDFFDKRTRAGFAGNALNYGGVEQIWYLPRFAFRNGVEYTITPVYSTVRDL